MKQAPKKVYKRRIKVCAKAPTLEDMVKAAHDAGATVTFSLVPKPEPATTRPLLQLSSDQWPGTPGVRSVLAAMDYTDKQVERIFKENPSSQWIITPYEIIERGKFFSRP